MPKNETQSSIVFRDIETISEMREVESLQKEIWGVDDREILPALALIPILEVGGVLIGAFDAGRMVAFVFGFPGYENQGGEQRLILHSDMLAVSPEYRSHGLGYKLKLAQRERALAKDIDRITWTFDPLQSLNAHLNIARLGVTADRYRVNYYGETTSFLHRGGTDRLWVTWDLNSERVKERTAGNLGPDTQLLIHTPVLVRMGEHGEPLTQPEELSQPSVAIEIPPSINTLLQENIELVVHWREATRAAFMKAMAAGFFVHEFFRVERNGRQIGTYLLSKALPWDRGRPARRG